MVIWVRLSNISGSSRFEKKVNLRKFKAYVTEVQMRSYEQGKEYEMNSRT